MTILTSFHAGGAHTWSWLWKLIFTAVTLSSGFKGGEVTPLFFIGAALGNTLAAFLGGPTDLFAAAGFVAVFAGATNTPLACTIMAIELFGGEFTVYFAVACLVAYFSSGHSGIYLSQRIGTPKAGVLDHESQASLRLVRAARSEFLEELLGSANGPINGKGERRMSHRHRVVSKEIGQLRIYLSQGERRPGKGLRGLFQRPLYRELIDLAKTEGIPNATSHLTYYGYSNHGKAQSDGVEAPNPNLNICVELVDQRVRLEHFCRKHADVLGHHVIVYKHLEHWELHAHQLDVSEATAEVFHLDSPDTLSSPPENEEEST